MVIDLIQNFANQVIRERLVRYSSVLSEPSFDALLMAAGYRTLDVLRPLVEVGARANARELSYSKCVAYGLVPATLRESGVCPQNPYKTVNDNGLSDPLLVASFFAAYGMTEAAEKTLAEREKIIIGHKRWIEKQVPEYYTDADLGHLDFGKSVAERGMQRTWVPPDFEELRLPRVLMHPVLDSFYLEGAFEQADYISKLKARLTPQVIDAFSRISGLKGKRLHSILRAASYDQARKLATDDKGSNFRYADMATYIRLCEPAAAMTLFDDLRGARQMITLVRHDTSSVHYIMGLRQLAQAAPTIRKEILERLGRGPTIEEIRSIRTIGMINILDEMDWTLLEPIVAEPGLRAAALPYAEKLGPVVLRRFLTDHPGRFKRIPNVETEPEVAGRMKITDASSIADWETVMDRLHRLHITSIGVRESLRDVTESDAISFIALLRPHQASSPDIDRTVASHPRWKDIERILADYTPPDLKTLWS